MRRAFLGLGQQRALTGHPLHLRLPSGALFSAKGGVLIDEAVALVKFYGIVHDNASRGLPDFNPVALLNDVATGLTLALMDAGWLTAVRTAAISAVAAQVLAPDSARRLGLIGSGRQAEAHYDLLRVHHRLSELTVYSRNAESAQALVARARCDGLQARVCTSPQEAVQGQDIVVSTIPRKTTSPTGMLDARLLEPQAFVSMVGLGFSWNRASLDALDYVISDEIDPQTRRSSEPLNYAGAFDADLADVLAQPRQARGRAALIFAGCGLADVAVGHLIWQRARERKLGTALAR